jgi:hypothetical protein
MNKSTKEHLYKEAIADLDSQLLPNYNATAKKYGLNRSTLSRRHQGKQQSRAPQTQYADNALLQLKKLP